MRSSLDKRWRDQPGCALLGDARRTLEDDLVNDAASGTPELDAVLAGSRLEEVKDFLVADNRTLRGDEHQLADPCEVGRPRLRTLRSASAPENALIK